MCDVTYLRGKAKSNGCLFLFFANVAERESFWPSIVASYVYMCAECWLEINIIYRMDYRRTPMYPLRRGIGGGDLADQRTHTG